MSSANNMRKVDLMLRFCQMHKIKLDKVKSIKIECGNNPKHNVGNNWFRKSWVPILKFHNEDLAVQFDYKQKDLQAIQPRVSLTLDSGIKVVETIGMDSNDILREVLKVDGQLS